MTKQTSGSNPNGSKGDPNKDVQPWLGWIAAMFVVVIVVVAVALGIDRTNNQDNNAAEVRMTPLVGGMEVPVATDSATTAVAVAEVTPLPEAISETATISMVTVITASSETTDTFPATGEMTPTETVSVTASLTATESVTANGEVTSTTEVTAVSAVVSTAAPTSEPTSEPTAITESTPEAEATVQPTVQPTGEPTPAATATPSPTATTRPAPSDVAEFEVGDIVVAGVGGAELYADASEAALVLDSYGSGVELEVLDPSGDFESYPVEADGHSWVRVRAADGLAGWVKTDQVEAQ